MTKSYKVKKQAYRLQNLTNSFLLSGKLNRKLFNMSIVLSPYIMSLHHAILLKQMDTYSCILVLALNTCFQNANHKFREKCIPFSIQWLKKDNFIDTTAFTNLYLNCSVWKHITSAAMFPSVSSPNCRREIKWLWAESSRNRRQVRLAARSLTFPSSKERFRKITAIWSTRCPSISLMPNLRGGWNKDSQIHSSDGISMK